MQTPSVLFPLRNSSSLDRVLTLTVLILAASACTKSATSGGTDGSTAHDSGPSDAGSTDAGSGLLCGQLLACDQKCGSSNTCTNSCYADSTANAQGLFNDFDDCLNTACPSTDGGACEDGNSTACSNCDQSAATAACITHLSGCENDSAAGPPNPDGGTTVSNQDAGPLYNCGELLACVTACAMGDSACETACTAQATPEAVSLQSALNSCLAIACPSTDGGPCEMAGLACNGCIEQVTLAHPNTCAAPYVACNSDTSNLSDGGIGPTALIDGGVIETVVGGLDQCASTMVVQGDNLYFTQVVDGSPVLVIALDGGTADGGFTTLGPPQPTPVSLAVDSNNVYVWSVGSFTLGSSINNQDGTVVQVPLGGGAAITLAQDMEVFYDAAYLNAVAIDTHSVYWVAGANGDDGAIMKTPIGGGSTPAPIFTGLYLPQAVTTDGTNVYWADWGTFNSQGRSNNDGTVWQGSVNGGTQTMLASNQSAPSAIAVAEGNVYWTNLGPLGGDNLPALNSGAVMMVPIGGGSSTLIAGSQAVPVALIVHDGAIYWSEYGLNAPGLIMTAPLSGSPVTQLAIGLDDPAELVFWGNTIYWTNANSSPTNGSISSLALP